MTVGGKFADATTASRDVMVWDAGVRLFHWSLVASFFIAYFTEDDLLSLHVWSGYAVGGLVAFRLVWGFVGPRHARFSDFLFAPHTVFAYLRDLLRQHAPRYVGHSPAGGAMVFSLLAGLALLVGSGLVLYAVRDNAGPLAGFLTGGDRRWWEEVHEIIANVLVVLIILHVAGVAWASIVHRENLVRAMFTGRKEVR